MKFSINKLFGAAVAIALGFASVSCQDDPEPVPAGTLQFEKEAREYVFPYERSAAMVNFKAPAAWHVEVENGVDWVFVSPAAGKAGDVAFELKADRNTAAQRECVLNVVCGDEKVAFTLKQARFGGSVNEILQPESTTINPDSIPNFDKFFPNSEYGVGILNKASRFSFARYRQSEHFFVFWDKKFGDEPNGPSVPTSMRVDIDDLLAKAEQFFDTNVGKLHMATLGQGKSQLDRYKMQIYLLYQEEWLATGSGYDNTIGALWVNPSTCQPAGSTIAHEVGHSFQYQVYCDKLLQGEADNMQHGFRYGFSTDGKAGCSYWEQCAQWQAHQDYPEEMFNYQNDTWRANYHRIFYHEFMRYASYWLQWYWVDKHGIDCYSRIWRESAFPQDPIEAYTALYNGGDMQRTYDELYDYAAHMVYYDIPGVRQYATKTAKGNYNTELYRRADGKYQVGYASTPGTAGFNVVRLYASPGKEVSVKVEALAAGSVLADRDPGKQVDADGKVKSIVKKYNTQANTAGGFRYGFVAIVDSVPVYSPMSKGSSGTARYTVPADADQLYFVISASPAKYNRVAWDDTEANDEQWPYALTVKGTDVYGYFEPSVPVYTKVDDTTLKLACDLTVDPSNEKWIVGSLDLATQEIANFTGIAVDKLKDAFQPAMIGIPVAPKEGKIVMMNRNADGTLATKPTANLGYYVDTEGTVAEYKKASLYFELEGTKLTFGKKTTVGKDGDSFVIRPVFVYTEGGKQKTIELTVTYRFATRFAKPKRIKHKLF